MYSDFDIPQTKVVVAGQGDIHSVLEKFRCKGVEYKFDSEKKTFRIKNSSNENKLFADLLVHLINNKFEPIHINGIVLTDGYYNSVEEYEADLEIKNLKQEKNNENQYEIL